MEYVALKDVCKINMGQSPDSSSYNDKKEGIPFYQGNADFGEKHPIPRVWCNAPTKIAQPKDILMSVRAPIGALNYAQEKCCIGRGLAAITPDKDKLSLEFLYWFLRGKNSELNSKGTGSTFKAISKKTLEEVRVPLIDLEKQQKMAQALEKTYSVIQMRTKQLKELDDLIKARFVEMFGDNDKKIAISSLCDVSGGYSFKSEDISSTGFIKILQIGNVYLDDVNWETTNYLPKGFDNVYSRFLLNEGDIVIALTRPIIQSLGNVKACIVKVSDTPCLLNQRVGRIVSKKNVDVNLKFIYGCLMTDDFTRYVESCCIGCSQPNISTKDIENYMIPDASYEKQMDFVKFKEQVDKSKLLSGCRLFHSWAPENRDKPKHVGVPQRKTKVLRGGRRQQ